MQAYKQPRNLLRMFSHSIFLKNDQLTQNGVFKCSDKRCKICAIYIQEGSTIPMSNGTTWVIKCQANCSSLNVLYFLMCNFCDYESYIGKTDDTRERTNNHITCCSHGTGTDMFDNHVFNCANNKGLPLIEPFFKLYIMMVCSDYNKLLDYESRFHSLGLDTMNRIN